MDLDGKMFAEELNKVLLQEGMFHTEVAAKAGISRTTMWRYIQGKRDRVSRKNAIKIANALGYHLQVNGRKCYLIKNKVIQDKTDKVYIKSDAENKTIGGCLDMLKDMDYRKITECEKLLGFIARLDEYEMIELSRLIDMLKEEKNKKMLVEKLRALVTLVMPYEAIKMGENHES
ncbi:MAG: helix-turn-helix domain-containing protein [candidate division KSB1 bacterium]|nr:helix-turn-helix domain-containing protein [candidate division KSB1 bacterium]